jgi:ABC-type branched-subunit amino acid transport system substrate-binding protein
MQRSKFLGLGATLGMAAMVAAACGQSSTTSKTPGAVSGTPVNTVTLAAAPGFDPATNTIHLGVILPLSGPVAVVGKPYAVGMETWVKYINSQGGIAGKYKLVLDEQDSQYSPAVTVQAYNKIKDNDLLIASVLGTDPTRAILPLLRADNMVASPTDLNSDWVHDPNLLPIGSPTQIEMINGAQYAVDSLGAKTKTSCILAQNDGYGRAAEVGINFAAPLLGFTVKTTARYAVGTTDMTPQIDQLKMNGCDIVYLGTTPDITAATFAKASEDNYGPQWIGTLPTYLSALAATPIKDYMMSHYLIVADSPEWSDRSVKGQADFLDRLAQFTPNQGPDYYVSGGYYQGWAVTQVIQKAVALGDLSRAGIFSAMAKVGDLSFDGITAPYHFGSPADRDPPRQDSIFKINPVVTTGLQKVKGPFVSDAAKAFSNFTSTS